MSQILITNIVYVLAFVVGLSLEHYGIIPVSSTNYIVGVIAGHAVASGTLSPNITRAGSGRKSNLIQDKTIPDHD
jgi:phosphate/sulfate permease